MRVQQCITVLPFARVLAANALPGRCENRDPSTNPSKDHGFVDGCHDPSTDPGIRRRICPDPSTDRHRSGHGGRQARTAVSAADGAGVQWIGCHVPALPQLLIRRVRGAFLAWPCAHSRAGMPMGPRV